MKGWEGRSGRKGEEEGGRGEEEEGGHVFPRLLQSSFQLNACYLAVSDV